MTAPYLWVMAVAFWAIHVNESLVRFTWVAFGVKGPGVGVVLATIETVALGIGFGLVLRILAGVSWPLPAAIFSAAFAVSFLLEATLRDTLEHAIYFAPHLVGLLACTSLAYAVISRRPGLTPN
jgi:hypothetical protein